MLIIIVAYSQAPTLLNSGVNGIRLGSEIYTRPMLIIIIMMIMIY